MSEQLIRSSVHVHKIEVSHANHPLLLIAIFSLLGPKKRGQKKEMRERERR